MGCGFCILNGDSNFRECFSIKRKERITRIRSWNYCRSRNKFGMTFGQFRMTRFHFVTPNRQGRN